MAKETNKHLFEEYFVAGILAIMLVLYFGNVLARYVFNFPMMFIDALLGQIFPWLTFIGAPAVCWRKRNIAFTYLTDRLPHSYQKYVELATTIVSVLLFSFLFYYGCIKTWSDFMSGNHISVLNNAPRWIFSLAIPLGALLYIYRTVLVAVQSFKDITTAKKSVG